MTRGKSDSPIKTQIKVEGLNELRTRVRKAKDREVTRAMKDANLAAARVVVDDSRPHLPRRSGAMAASLKAAQNVRNAVVKMGTPSKVPYAGPIHFGWPKRNIKPQPAISVGIVKRKDDIRETYAEALKKVLDVLDTKGL